MDKYELKNMIEVLIDAYINTNYQSNHKAEDKVYELELKIKNLESQIAAERHKNDVLDNVQKTAIDYLVKNGVSGYKTSKELQEQSNWWCSKEFEVYKILTSI